MPYGPVMLCTILKNAGHDVTLKDFLLPAVSSSADAPVSFQGKKGPRYQHFGLPMDGPGGCLEWIDDNVGAYDVVCLAMCQCNLYETSALIAARVKMHGKPLVIGGPFVTTAVKEATELTGADLACIGEGELRICGLVERAAAWGERGGVFGDPVMDLDALPVPDWDFAPPNTYPAVGGKVRGVLCVSRGCPWECTFCSVHTIMGRKHRRLCVERIVMELEELIRHGVEYVSFLDDNLFISPQAIDDVLRAIEECKAKHPKWGKRARFYVEEGIEVRVMAIPGVAERIKKAGFQRIAIGMETYNDARKDENKKPYTREQLVAAVENCKAAGVAPRAFYIIGLPGDTIESVAQDLVGFAALGIEARTNNLKLYPGTQTTKWFDELGLIPGYDWRLSSYYTPDLPGMSFKDVRALRNYLTGISTAAGEIKANLVSDSVADLVEKFMKKKYMLRIQTGLFDGAPYVEIEGNMFRPGPLAYMAEIVCLRLGAKGVMVARNETNVVARPMLAPMNPIQAAVARALQNKDQT
jgi:radical SAM superfamily enzyme YgiQ (UPF0313 family)